MLSDTHPHDLWVFGYGSLMWRPGFDHVERIVATLHGFHRALCVYSHVHRGTPDNPGLVLGLDRGGSCRGIAFRVRHTDTEKTIDYLRAREQVTMVYRETRHTLRLIDGRTVSGIAFTIDRTHRQYAPKLEFDELLRLIRQGVGVSGANPDYVTATHAHLVSLGLHDHTLSRLSRALENV